METHKQYLTAIPKAYLKKKKKKDLITSSFLISLKDLIQNTPEGSMANQMLNSKEKRSKN